MYEVFLNDRRIVIPDSSGNRFICCDRNPEWIADPVTLQKIIYQFFEGNEKILILQGKRDWLWQQFKSVFTLIPAAGGIVQSDYGFLFIFRRGKWDLPKGKIDRDESPAEAALREVSEETGIKNLSVKGHSPSTWHIYRSPKTTGGEDWILKETKWFYMTASGDEPLVAEISEDIEDIRWLRPEELDLVLSNTYASLEKLINNLRTGA